ncbi:uncharacterized protein LOC128960106 [Oppia nitens]|uniref:uncharacterized protein LOC128960106 n=1 Tax=Oppia nitens TaxID=1686743 RepID=UPI0023DAB0AC|nr:uncharacterized protein LOC128960106 [Oppia nitens]
MNFINVIFISLIYVCSGNPSIDNYGSLNTGAQYQQHLTPLQIDTLNYGQSAGVLLSPVDLKLTLTRTTEIHNIENYDKCQSTGKLNVVTVGRDELFFLNMSCLNYYTSNPLARETLSLTLGDRLGVLTPIVNFTITNVVRNGYHYEIHEGIVADGDLINATVTKVKMFAESDFQKGCAQEPGLQYIPVLRSDISFKAPFGDYAIACETVQNPGNNYYRPGIVAPEVLATQRASTGQHFVGHVLKK